MKLEAVFGLVLREQRLLKNLSQIELSASSGLDRTFISLIERGIRQPSLHSIFQLATGLNLEPSELLQLVEKNLRRTRWKRLKAQ